MGKYQITKKKHTGLAAVLAMLLLAAGGMLLRIHNRPQINPAESTEPTVMVTAVPETEPETEPEEPQPWYQYSDPSQWITTGEEDFLSDNAKYRLPAMNEALAAAPEFSQWVSEIYEAWCYSVPYDTSSDSLSLDYDCGVYDDLLSVTMEFTCIQDGEKRRGWPQDGFFTVDLRTGKKLTTDRFIEIYGGSWDQLEIFARLLLHNHYTLMEERYNDPEAISQMQEKELSSENLRKMEIVVDARNGRIRMIFPQLFTIDGDGKMFSLEEPSSDPYLYMFPAESPYVIFGK